MTFSFEITEIRENGGKENVRQLYCVSIVMYSLRASQSLSDLFPGEGKRKSKGEVKGENEGKSEGQSGGKVEVVVRGLV